MTAELKLDPELAERVQQLSAATHRTADAILREALEHYIKNRNPDLNTDRSKAEDTHPSGQPWPTRSPVGGIITPV